MRLVLRQTFPLGRFHATPWRVNPFDDPHGEWPPSPWRLVRAVVARWYQWMREADEELDFGQLDKLVSALCASRYAFHLPVNALRGKPLRQYQPTVFAMDPPNLKAYSADFEMPANGTSDALQKALHDAGAQDIQIRDAELRVQVDKREAKKRKKRIEKLLGIPPRGWHGLSPDPGFRSYETRLYQDNYWCVSSGEDGTVWWFLEGDCWTDTLVESLDRCLERVIYFGRTEAFTRIRRVSESPPQENCTLVDRRVPGAVPLLAPHPEARRADVERVTDDAEVAGRSVPPGARMMYALRPPRPPAREKAARPAIRRDCNLLQFAIGSNVAPEPRAIVRLTARFRGGVIQELVRIKTGDPKATWNRASKTVREAVADMTGKDAKGKALTGPHRHAEFLAWCEDGIPTRLLVWRDGRPFDENEQTAILRAASRELSWAGAGPDADAWKVKLVPLDRTVPPPPGFDGVPALTWESLTPYVPPRHHLRGGKPRTHESLAAQIRRELSLRGLPGAEHVEAEQIGDACWVAVHIPRSAAMKRAFIGDRRGYWIRLAFREAVSGPLRLGHSSSFGLGLFKPVSA